MRTPWGDSDHSQKVAEGIVFYGTPSHGGYKLDAKRLAAIPRAVLEATSGRLGLQGWFEEDCDWSIVPRYFPQAFDAKARQHAARCFDSWVRPSLPADFADAEFPRDLFEKEG